MSRASSIVGLIVRVVGVLLRVVGVIAIGAVWGWAWAALAIVLLAILPNGMKLVNGNVVRTPITPIQLGVRILVELTVLFASFVAVFSMFGAFAVALFIALFIALFLIQLIL